MSKSKSKLSRRSFSFEAIGTRWQIDVACADTALPELQRIVQERITAFDYTYSRFRSDSWLSGLTQVTGVVDLPEDALPLFDMYEHMYEISEGAVTPLIGQLLSDAGYDADYRLTPQTLTAPPTWQEAMTYDRAHHTLRLHQPVMLDVGAAGKGYLVDIVSELLESLGVREYCVDAGGDMRQRLPADQPALRVGLEHPDSPGQVVGVVHLGNQSLCGSAGNRRQWAGLHHIMNPHTLQPERNIKAAWAIASHTLLADAMTTSLFFVSGELLRQQFDFSYTIIYSDNSFFMSPDFPGELFTQ